MPLCLCEHPSCIKPADRIVGSCVICGQHFCNAHSVTPFHDCPSDDTDPEAFFTACRSAKRRLLTDHLRRVNTGALITLASSLRGGIPCQIPALALDSQGNLSDVKLASLQMGGQNCHVDIVFDDEIVWLARIRLQLSEFLVLPKEALEYVFLSEVATLKFLEGTRVPAPKVFHFALEGPDNPVGVMFLIMNKMKGISLDWNKATPPQKTKVVEQLVDVYLELEKYPFDRAGSMIGLDGSTRVGAYAEPLMFESPTKSLGPFDTLKSSLTAIVQHQMRLISDGEISLLAEDHYLSHCWRLNKIPAVVADQKDAQFYLKHADDKGDHILVDEDYNITGIIDWEWASTETNAFALSSPCMLWPVGDFYDGKNNLSAEELEFASIYEKRGRKDIAEIVRNGRKMQRFLFSNGGASRQLEEFEALFQGLRRAWADTTKEDVGDYESWKSGALTAYAQDPVLKELLRKSRG